MSDLAMLPPTLAIAGTGNFATNLAALCASFGLETLFFVDEFRRGEFLGKPVFTSAQLGAQEIRRVQKWVLAVSHAEHRQAAAKRLQARGIPADRIIALADDPSLQILRLLFEQYSTPAIEEFCSRGLVEITQLEERFLKPGREKVLYSLDADRQTIGLGYFGRGGGFRRHISSLIPLLEARFNVVTLSDEVMGGAEEAGRHLYLSADAACTLNFLDLVLSAHVFPCAPPSVPRVSFSHVIYDFNLSAEYHASRIALSDNHYLFASSRPSFDWYVDLVQRYALKNRICVIPGGYLQLDRNRAALQAYDGPRNSIIYAPTLSLADYPHSELVTSINQGPAILESLLAGFPDREILFRPHPSDLRLYELERQDPRCEPFGRMLDLCRIRSGCRLDDNVISYLESYSRADLMVSDSSSTAFTFALATGRPVIFYSPRERELVAALGESLQFIRDREEVGLVVSSLDSLPAAVESLLQNRGREEHALDEFRDRMIFNPGSSARYFVDNIDFILKGEQHPQWHYINW